MTTSNTNKTLSTIVAHRIEELFDDFCIYVAKRYAVLMKDTNFVRKIRSCSKYINPVEKFIFLRRRSIYIKFTRGLWLETTIRSVVT